MNLLLVLALVCVAIARPWLDNDDDSTYGSNYDPDERDSSYNDYDDGEDECPEDTVHPDDNDEFAAANPEDDTAEAYDPQDNYDNMYN